MMVKYIRPIDQVVPVKTGGEDWGTSLHFAGEGTGFSVQ